jgi:hypothetical protein
VKKLIIIGIIGSLLLVSLAINAQSDEMASQAPPVAQTLIREGDFAVKLADKLKLGTAQNEAEAESTLTSSGIAPKNGWIADYPVTPDIIGELQNAIDDATESGRLSMSRDEATKTFQDLTTETGLPVMASKEGADEFSNSEPPGGYGSYSNPEMINNYYNNEGPPVVTYYPPPPDYYYMYAWVPYPFWWAGFWFPGFFCLHDFDRIIIVNHRHHRFTNHYFHPRWRRTVTVDPARRGTDSPFRAALDRPRTHSGYGSAEARSGASSILERSRERARSGGTAMARPDRRPNDRSSFSRPGNRPQGQPLNREGSTSTPRSRSSDQARPPASDRRMSRPPAESNLGNPSGPRSMTGRTYTPPTNPPPNVDRRSNMNFQRPSSGEIRSSSPPSQGNVRSFSPPSQGNVRSFSSPSIGGGGSFGMPQTGGSAGGFGHRGF